MPVTNYIFVFSDRPYRDYAYLNGEEYASLWDDNEETDKFYTDPPNDLLTCVIEMRLRNRSGYYRCRF